MTFRPASANQLVVESSIRDREVQRWVRVDRHWYMYECWSGGGLCVSGAEAKVCERVISVRWRWEDGFVSLPPSVPLMAIPLIPVMTFAP
jgi:hypothetical protein